MHFFQSLGEKLAFINEKEVSHLKLACNLIYHCTMSFFQISCPYSCTEKAPTFSLTHTHTNKRTEFIMCLGQSQSSLPYTADCRKNNHRKLFTILMIRKSISMTNFNLSNSEENLVIID